MDSNVKQILTEIFIDQWNHDSPESFAQHLSGFIRDHDISEEAGLHLTDVIIAQAIRDLIVNGLKSDQT
jgi:hypothetical protein